MKPYTFGRTLRGFRFINFEDRNREEGQIQESSIADEPCLWIGVEGKRLHITQDDARKIAGILQYFADIGELPDNFEALQD